MHQHFLDITAQEGSFAFSREKIEDIKLGAGVSEELVAGHRGQPRRQRRRRDLGGRSKLGRDELQEEKVESWIIIRHYCYPVQVPRNWNVSEV